MSSDKVPVDAQLEESLLKLQDIEQEIQEADLKVENFKNELFESIYEKRAHYLKNIPKFWFIVLAQHEDLQEYIDVEDMKYLELISELNIKFWKEEAPGKDEILPKKGFTINISFQNNDGNADNKIKEQTVVKKFTWVIDLESGERVLQSDNAEIEWPEALKTQNPAFIKETAKKENRQLTSDEKKRYRKGMRSFFSFFSWTGRKQGKEFRNGEELATLLADDIFPAALDYYILAAPGLSKQGGSDDDSEDDETGEELDLSEQDSDEGHDSKRQKK